MVLLLETRQEKSFWKVKESIIRRSVPKRQWNTVVMKLQKEDMKLLEGSCWKAMECRAYDSCK
jgi:hypothetical protein